VRPKEHVCYCDGFGVCFGGEEEYNGYYAKKKEKQDLEDGLRSWEDGKARIEGIRENAEDISGVDVPDEGSDGELRRRIEKINR
jgi:hypothetical protein